MRMSCRFASLDVAEGFVEGLEYVNDSEIYDIHISHDPISNEWVVKFEDDDMTENPLTYIYTCEADDDESCPFAGISNETRNPIRDLEELYEDEDNV